MDIFWNYTIFVCWELGNFLKEIVALKNAENFCHKNSMARGFGRYPGGGGGTPLRWPYGYVLLEPQRIRFFNRTSIAKQS